MPMASKSEAGSRFVFCSGQLGIGTDGVVPDAVEDQARLCFRAIAAILGEAGMSLADVVRLNAYVVVGRIFGRIHESP